MDKAFAAPRLDFYDVQHFALDREVLKERGLDRPDMLLAAEWSQPIPNLQQITLYEDIQLQDIGDAAEKAGRTEDALAAYWRVVHFGERLGASPMGIAQTISNKLRRDAYKYLAPLLRRKGRAGEATAVESALAALPPFDYSHLRPGYPSIEATARRSARVIVVSGVFVALLGTATALWLIFVVALKWKFHLGPLGHLMNRLASPLCFAPPAMLLASMALFLGFYPYARSITQFHSYNDLEYGYVPVLLGVYDVARFGNLNDVWLFQMFWPLVWCVVVALVGAGFLAWMRSRPRPDSPDAA
jgi:hypothetical protein